MTDEWFIQSHARISDKAQPSETTLQWSDPRWMSGARRNENHQARVRLAGTLTRLILKMKRVRCHGTGDAVAGGGLVGLSGHDGEGGGSPGPLLRVGVGLLVLLVHLVQVGWTQEKTGSQHVTRCFFHNTHMKEFLFRRNESLQLRFMLRRI